MKQSTKTLLCVLLAIAAAVCILAACFTLTKKQNPSSGSSAASTAPTQSEYGTVDSFDYQNFTYSDGLDANGYRTGITAQDYVTLPDNVAALPIKKADVTPSDSDVQARIDSLLSQYSTTQAVTDRAAQNGDVVNIDYSGTVDGVAFNGGTYQGYDLTLGSGSFITGFEDQIVGHNTGDTFDVTVTFPDGYDATGSGKTTLVSLIPRFYDATAGQVLVDGVDVKDYTFDALYDKLGYVTQKAVLFSGSIKDNVFFGESAVKEDDADLKSAIEISQAEEFIEKLPEGTEHHIAQMGRNVSGGQKQRLSVARALARKPEILVFDDSFSALDYRTDAKLREGLVKELPGTTKVIVAQRISTIRHADQILVLDRGEAVGIGTHEELMRSCSVYREIATSQLSAAELPAFGSP